MGRTRRGWPLQAYFAVLIVLFTAVAVGAAAYVHLRTDSDARHSAEQHTRFAAETAAKQLGDEVAALRAAVAQLGGAPGAALLFKDASNCSLSYSGIGGPDAGHIDIVAPDGRVLCSSRAAPGKEAGWTYPTGGWLRLARSKAQFVAPERDPATGQPAVIAAAPIPGHGVAVGVSDLAPLAPALAKLYGGPEPTVFLISDSARRTVLGRSLDPSRWIGTSLIGTPYAGSTHASEHRDLDGKTRIYSDVAVPGAGWTLYAGVEKATAFQAVAHLQTRQLLIVAGGLLVVLLAVLFTYYRIARPIDRLSSSVSAAGADGPSRPVIAEGPAQVRSLAEEINGFTESVQRELTARRSAETAAEASEQNYRLLFEASPQPMWLYDPETLTMREANAAALDSYGYTRSEFLALAPRDLLSPELAEALEGVRTADDRVMDRAGPFSHVKKDGTEIEVRITAHTVMFEGRRTRFVMVEDVGERERLERQLRQSQRLESLGHLAGGVAHDFNNLLAVIVNCAAFVGEEIAAATNGGAADWATARNDLDQVERAAERGAGLTRQLLSFARREVVQPEVVDINQIVGEIEPLLLRTLGEHVELTAKLGDSIWPVVIDPGQLEQVLVNLAVNARDAMPGGGRLRIDTENIHVDSEFAAARLTLAEGRYVRVRVSDTGVGMDDQTLQRVFEPFFTTKPPGEGTGLGLATVYGIITQAGGYAQVYSEPGIGTTFTALIPASDEQPADAS
ncbi:MAG: hypothetical protein QOJ57_2536, partial [Thermoleophilaceae bacterium]|nr:hypothetical protein [Thermoleophilaceae bacterium]